MILLINTFITDTVIPGRSPQQKLDNRTFLKTYTAFDVFKYSLSSLSKAHNWKRIILNISLDNNYLYRKDELESFINEEFKEFPIHIKWKRNIYQLDWQETYELLDDELIWFSCNHDHIFLDSSQEYLNIIVNEMKKDADTLISSCYTHWPEQIAYVSNNRRPSDLVVHDDYATMNKINVDSINIISKILYKKWWFSNDLPPNLEFPRTDWPHNMIFNFVNCGNYQKNFIPFKELSRHFDAYYHLNMHQCFALNIPNGFFEKNIKISIGNILPIDGYTWFNPSIDKYSAESVDGADYKWCEEDIPIGWKNRVSEIKTIYNDDFRYEHRLKSIVDMLYVQYTFPMTFDQNVLNKILNVWMKPYGLTTC